jgi:sec-independent protein translocase protein TatC
MAFRARAKQRDNDDARMTLMEHLTELRNRIIICAVALAVAGVVGFVIYPHLLHWLDGPLREATKGKPCAGGTKGSSCDQLLTTNYLQPFLVRLKLSSYFAIFVGSPVVMWEIWRFVTPGLSERERKYALPFIISSVVLFALGGVVAWYTLPKALHFLINIGGPTLDVRSTADAYVTLVGLMFLAFGLSFEFPVLLVFLLLVRVLNTRVLRKYRRHAIVGITIFAAVITPSQDPYSLFLMAIPMWIFYEASIIIGRILDR